MTRLTPFVAALAVAAASLACGGADAPPPEEAPAASPGLTGRAPAATGGVPSIVMLRPVDGGSAAPPDGPAILDQLGLEFLPKALVVREGQAVRFVNSESLAHNVHVWWMENDSSLYFADMDPGDSGELVLEREGAYDVTCDEHPGMRAVIYVTSAPYAAFADPNGSFVMPDVPRGSYTAQAWAAASGLGAEVTVDVAESGTELDLTGSQ